MLPTTIIGWIFFLLVLIWIFHNPAGAGADLKSWVDDVLTFITSFASSH